MNPRVSWNGIRIDGGDLQIVGRHVPQEFFGRGHLGNEQRRGGLWVEPVEGTDHRLESLQEASRLEHGRHARRLFSEASGGLLFQVSQPTEKLFDSLLLSGICRLAGRQILQKEQGQKNKDMHYNLDFADTCDKSLSEFAENGED